MGGCRQMSIGELGDEAFLFRVLTEESWEECFDSPSAGTQYMPVHAWRALGQMRPVAVLEPMLRIGDSDIQHAYDDVPTVCAMIGEPAIEPLILAMRDRSRTETARTMATIGLGHIGRAAASPNRTRIVTALLDQI